MEQYTTLGKTGLRVSKLGFGCIKFNSISESETTAALNLALDRGINFFDTARNYGTSEQKLGAARLFQRRGASYQRRGIARRRSDFILATKTHERSAEGLCASLQTSLRELQTDYIDLYQLHSVSTPAEYARVMAPDGALEGAKKAKQQGKIRHIGASIHRSLDTMRKCITSGEFETVMLAYSAIDQENVAADVLPLAAKHGVGVIVMKPLSGGQFVAKPAPGDAARRTSDAGSSSSIVRACLRYVLANDEVSVCCPGMASVREVEDNVATWKIAETMSFQERDELVRSLGAFKKAYRYGQVCLRCGYCQPCPQEIDVPAVFRAHDMIREYPEELKYEGWNLLLNLPVMPDVCEACGECVKKCPAGISIPARLKEISDQIKAHKARKA